jgi:ATP-dependent Clp protease ATP-binding subunit ClpC
MKEMKNFFSPEFINRIDDTIVFNTLSSEDIKKITRIELDKLMERIKGMNYTFTYDDKLVDLIHKVGYDETYGARPIKRAIQDRVEDYISEEILKGIVKEGESRVIDVIDDQLVLIQPHEVEEETKKRTRKKRGVN